MTLAFAYRAFPSGPLFMATKPVSPRAFRAAVTAFIHVVCFPLADAFLLTTFPRLLRKRSAAVSPPTVFSFLPASTLDLAPLPLAILLALAFIPFVTAFMTAFDAGFFVTFRSAM